MNKTTMDNISIRRDISKSMAYMLEEDGRFLPTLQKIAVIDRPVKYIRFTDIFRSMSGEIADTLIKIAIYDRKDIDIDMLRLYVTGLSFMMSRQHVYPQTQDNKCRRRDYLKEGLFIEFQENFSGLWPRIAQIITNGEYPDEGKVQRYPRWSKREANDRLRYILPTVLLTLIEYIASDNHDCITRLISQYTDTVNPQQHDNG